MSAKSKKRHYLKITSVEGAERVSRTILLAKGGPKGFSIPHWKLIKRWTGTFHTANLLSRSSPFLRPSRVSFNPPPTPIFLLFYQLFSGFSSSPRPIFVWWVPSRIESICKAGWSPIFISSMRRAIQKFASIDYRTALLLCTWSIVTIPSNARYLPKPISKILYFLPSCPCYVEHCSRYRCSSLPLTISVVGISLLYCFTYLTKGVKVDAWNSLDTKQKFMIKRIKILLLNRECLHKFVFIYQNDREDWALNRD